jgi:hypothetical protein
MLPKLSLLPDDPGRLALRRQLIVDWWCDLHNFGEPGRASWEELGRLEQQVTDSLAKARPDICRAESLTAEAMLLIAGYSDL